MKTSFFFFAFVIIFLASAEVLNAQSKVSSKKKTVKPNDISFWRKDYDSALSKIEAKKFAEADSLFALSMKNYLKKNVKKDSLYASLTNNIAVAWANKGFFDKGIELLKEALLVHEKVNGKKEAYIECSANIGSVLQIYGKINEAEPYYKRALEAAQKMKMPKDAPLLIGIQNSLGNYYRLAGKTEEAHKIYGELYTFYENQSPLDSAAFARVCNNWGLVHREKNLINEAQHLFEKSLALAGNNKQTAEWAQSANNLADIFNDRRNFTEAEKYYLQALSIRENLFGKNHLSYIQSANNISNLYSVMGLHDKAFSYQKEVLKLYEKNYGRESINYIILKANELQHQVSNDNKIEDLEEILALAKKVAGEKHHTYGKICGLAAKYYVKKGDDKNAEIFYLKQYNVIKNYFGNNHIRTGFAANDLGVFYTKTDSFKLAEQYLNESLACFELVAGVTNRDYIKNLLAMAMLKKKAKSIPEAKLYFDKALALNNQMIESNIYVMTDDEKHEFVSASRSYIEAYFNFLVKYRDEIPDFADKLLEQSLYSKSLVLEVSRAAHAEILSKTDTVLAAKYELLKEKKNAYAKVQLLTAKSLDEKGIKIENLRKDIENIETEISRLMQEKFGKQTRKEITLENVKKNLGANDVLIDFVRCFDKEKESFYYAALIISPKRERKTEVVFFENGNELENQILNYYRNCMSFKRQDTVSYTKFWQPVRKLLEEIGYKKSEKGSRLYIVPEGVFHQINFNTLYDAKSQKYFIDDYNLFLLGTMRDLKSDNDQIKAISSKQGKISVAMFGFPAFESESADTENKTDTERNFMFESLQRTTFSGKKIADLPGTKDELDFLQKKLTKKKIKSEVFIREDASEEKIKQIASPAILHIATHGFFMPEADKSKLKNAEEHVEAQRLRNAMMRSGLLLAGCANPAYSNEDGILTALEVMDLNLLNTELVALSACETGLGDNRGSEGVWGLKSAFQQAGARTVLISLWKVSDEATQYLMSAFYTALLSGESKRQALKTAQMKTRAKYKHPYFWGGFVMQGS